MEYDINKIKYLCTRYMEAETSAEEEVMLRDYFTNAEDIPESLISYKVMICGFSEAGAMKFKPKKYACRRGIVRRIVWGSIGVAASIAICIAAFERETYGYDIEGKAITDPEEALKGTIYLSYLSNLETTIDIAETITRKMEDND